MYVYSRKSIQMQTTYKFDVHRNIISKNLKTLIRFTLCHHGIKSHVFYLMPLQESSVYYCYYRLTHTL